MATALEQTHCACCFRSLRLLPPDADRWTWVPQDALVAVVRHDRAPYGDILCALGAAAKGALVRACDHCNQFLRRRVVFEEADARVRAGRYHAMHLTIDFIMSGGLTPPPCRPNLERCLGLLVRPAMDHPFLALDGLRERLLARRRLLNADCIVRWLLAGRPHVFSSLAWGRRVRQWRSGPAQRATEALWAELEGVHACRFCARGERVPVTTYQGALAFGRGDVEARLGAEEATLLVPGESATDEAARIARWVRYGEGLLFFCPTCRRLGVISHAYHATLWPRLGLAPVAAPDAYYSQMLARVAKKKRALARGLAPLPDLCAKHARD